MADEEIQQVEEGLEPQPAAPAEPDRFEALQSELKAMREEQAAREQKWAEERQGYMTQFGQLLAQQRQAPSQTATSSDPRSYFDAETAKNIELLAEQIAERKANTLLGRARVLQPLQGNSELEKLAQAEMQAMAQEPYYQGWSEDARLAVAVERGRSKLYEQQIKASQTKEGQAQLQQAAAAQAAGASLPGTPVAGEPSGSRSKNLAEYIKEFSADPQNRAMVKRFTRYDPDSKEGQEWLTLAAKENWKGIAVDGALGKAVEFVTRGER